MKILCTGATGFIGSNLVPALLTQRHTVAVLKRKTSGLKHLENYKGSITTYDYSTYSDIYEVLQESKPDLLIHLATLYINKHTEDDVQPILDSNICFGMHILEAMKRSGVSKILNFGTRWQHINNELYNPANLYAATKQAFYDILRWYNKDGIMSKTLELCDTFGPNDIRKKIVNLLVEACKNKKMIDLSPGEQILDITYVDSLVEYIIANIENDSFFDNEVIQIAGSEIKLKDLGNIIEDACGVRGFLNWGKMNYRKNEVMKPPLCNNLNIAKLEGKIENDIIPLINNV